MALLLRRAVSTSVARRAPLLVDEKGPYFVNNNPRNAEQLRIERKQEGWTLEPDRRNFWNRLRFHQGAGFITGYVEHCSGAKVVRATTREPCISRHLTSSSDVTAAYNIGRVLAHRCLKAGLLEIHCDFSQQELETSSKKRRFVEGLKDTGVMLEEQQFIASEPVWAKKRHVKPWLVTEQMALQDT